MDETPAPVKPWSKPLISWSEVHFPFLFIALQMVFTVPLAFLSSKSLGIGWFIWNGVALAIAYAVCTPRWIRMRKYTKWKVSIDGSGVNLVTHKGQTFEIDWSNFKGYEIVKRPRKLIKLISQDGLSNFEMPWIGVGEFHETVTRLVCDLDRHLPVGGIRVSAREPRLRIPKWIAGAMLVIALPMLGVPVWVLALNGFAATPEIVIEVISRNGRVIWPCVLLGPVLFLVGIADIGRVRAEKKEDRSLPEALGTVVGFYPANQDLLRVVRVLMAGLLLIIFFMSVFISGAIGIGTISAMFALALIPLFSGLNVSLRRVTITTKFLVIRQRKKEWAWEHGTYTVKTHAAGKSEGLYNIGATVLRDGVKLQLIEQWSDGDWLSRAISRANAVRLAKD